MDKRWKPFAAATLILTVATVCEDPAGPYAPANVPARVIVAFQTDPDAWRADPLAIDSASIENDVLRVHVTHGGGCEQHEYAAVAWNGWLESNPVQVGVMIAHDGKDDACDALVKAELRFDLIPLRQAYSRAYGSGASQMILRLNAASARTGGALMISYTFS
jgi:hypothetical protein